MNSLSSRISNSIKLLKAGLRYLIHFGIGSYEVLLDGHCEGLPTVVPPKEIKDCAKCTALYIFLIKNIKRVQTLPKKWIFSESVRCFLEIMNALGFI